MSHSSVVSALEVLLNTKAISLEDWKSAVKRSSKIKREHSFVDSCKEESMRVSCDQTWEKVKNECSKT